ncbi:MAG: DUF1015 domain-containing protein, partial [Oscillospiraceae bacterium]
RSRDYFDKWIEEQVLIYEDEPVFYIYEQLFEVNTAGAKSNSLKGIISLVQLEEFSKKVVLPHEETISKAKTDRLNLMETTGANMSQIYSLYLDENKKIGDILEKYSDGEPDISFTTKEDATQNIWIVKDKETLAEITRLFEEKQIFIADGHHRYETALNYRNEQRAKNPSDTTPKPYDYVMMMLVSMDDSGLFVFPTHRMLKNLKRFDENMAIGFLTDDFVASKIHFTEGDFAEIMIEKLRNTVDEKLFAFYTGQNYYYLLKLKDSSIIDKAIEGKSDAYKHLDVTILHTLILEKYFGIDAENMADQKNLFYTRDEHEAIQAVKDGEYQCSFLINATKVSDIKEISLANEKMPQKSTYFWPKLVTGIVINKF